MVIKTLKEAIEKKKRIEIIYEKSVRIVEPYLVGINEKSHVALRAFQTGGFSSSGKLPAWRLFLIDRIEAAQILDEHFEINSLYNPDDRNMTQILFRVERNQ
ncbi:MAG TPA: hypothetical protein DCE78_06835 [Bacteroidetes bacterium]|jgi:predicted DNA-binding transcriptional regulator YafY|nr:hypothetical protein [Bacteroidota bacterium]